MPDGVQGRINFLGRIPLLSNLSALELAVLARGVVERSYEPRQIIFAEEDPSTSVFIIRRGTIKVVKYSPSGKTLILRLEASGALLGEVAVIDGQPYPATVEAVDDVWAYEISRGCMISFMRAHPDFAIHLCRMFALRLRATYNVVQDFSLAPIEQRVAVVLLKLCNGLAETDERGMTGLKMRISRQDIADMTGCARESVCRVTARFKRQGLIQVRRGQLYVAQSELQTWLSSQEGSHVPYGLCTTPRN